MKNMVNEYISQLKNMKILSPKKIKELFEKGDEASKTKIIESCYKMVPKIVNKYYKNLDDNYMDLIQHGNLGLVTAINRYDPNNTTLFSTFAYYYIEGYILCALSSVQSNGIVNNRYATAKFHKIEKAEEELMQKLNRDPALSELRESLKDKFTIKTLNTVLEAKKQSCCFTR